MTATTERLSLPFIEAGQAQKEITHNEALLLLDMLVQPSVVSVGRNDPPVDPMPGQCWIIGPMPTGAWVEGADELTVWTAGGWRYIVPRAGMRAWSEADGIEAMFEAGRWHLGSVAAKQIVVDGERVIGPRQPAIANPTGGSTPDAEARQAIVAVIGALRAHGLIS